jgi:hypothetical protein
MSFAHGLFSGIGRRAAGIAADIVRFEDGLRADHWDGLQDEATQKNPSVVFPRLASASLHKGSTSNTQIFVHKIILFTYREQNKVMNKEKSMELAGPEGQTLQTAIAALQATAGLKTVKVDVRPLTIPLPNPRADAVLAITLNGHKQLFVAEIKTIDRRIAVAQIRAQLMEVIAQRYPGHRPLLVTTFVTPALAEECRKLDLPFLDTAGNLYLPTDTFVVDIRGMRPPARPLKDTYRANNPTGLKIVFALLCRPALAGATYREIAKFAEVALGAIGPVLNDLKERGYIQKTKTQQGVLLRRRELLNEWVTYYPASLRPTLRPRRYQADREQLTHVELEAFRAYWGGEYGAEKLTRYLKAEHFLIYAPATTTLTPLLAKARMRLAADGNTEILETFWHAELLDHAIDIAPPLLVYADLMATTDGRNIEAAKEVYERFLEPLVDQP